MIREMVDIRVRVAQATDFEAAVAASRGLFEKAPGCLGFEVMRSIEESGYYRMIVHWRTLEDHLEGFQKSESFRTWKKQVGQFYERPPTIQHFEIAS